MANSKVVQFHAKGYLRNAIESTSVATLLEIIASICEEKSQQEYKRFASMENLSEAHWWHTTGEAIAETARKI